MDSRGSVKKSESHLYRNAVIGSGGWITYWTILVWSPARGTSPQKITTPFGGACLNVLSRDAMESIALVTFFIVVFDLMLDACDCSFLRYAITSEIGLFSGT